MTAPQQPPDSQQQQTATASLAVLLASGLTVTAMVPYAVAILAPLGVSAAAATAALRLASTTLAVPLGRPLAAAARTSPSNVVPLRRSSPAITTVRTSEAAMRAAYMVNAARRISRDLKAASRSVTRSLRNGLT